jgi:hypothetical protein
MSRIVLLGWIVLLAVPLGAHANHPDFAACPFTSGTTTNPPTSTLVVRILSVRPNSDLEGDDDNVPFYDNHADIYGLVTIADETFELPEKSETDFPHWDDSNGTFRKEVTGGPVPIAIDIRESDGGITGDDDQVDVTPVAGKDVLELEFDLCSLRLTGDAGELQTQNVITVSAGDDDEDATIQLEIEFEDGRPVTVDDLAIIDVDLVQVVYDQPNLVAGKPTIVVVRLANNHPQEVSTNLSVYIQAGAMIVDRTFPITIHPGQVQSYELFMDAPVIFPPAGSYVPFVRVSVVDPSSAPPDDCRHQNDDFVSGAPVIPILPPATALVPGAFWQVVTTKTPRLTWAPVGRLLDVFNCASDNEVEEIRGLGTAFLRGTFPVADVANQSNPLPVCITPPITDALDYLTTLLRPFGIPADALMPFALVFELNAVGAITAEDLYVDRLIGVLPSDWFDVFSYGLWEGASGLSGTEFAPYAVILEADTDGFPIMIAPAHEVGHTFGASVQPEIKSWICGEDFPGDLDALACGAVGGLDERNADSEPNQFGYPSTGYWLRQGGEPPTLADGLFGQQCDSHCLMGSGSSNDFQNWGNQKHWIDTADYDHLLNKMNASPLFGETLAAEKIQASESIFISGMIGYDDQVHFGPWFRKTGVTPDRTDPFGLYSFRFEDASGNLLGEVGIPIHWNQPDANGGIPVTMFGLYVPFPAGTDHVDVVNTKSGDTIATHPISPSAPQVRVVDPTPNETEADCALRIAWEASDADGDALEFTVLLRPAGGIPYPVGVRVKGNELIVNASAFPAGPYEVTVLANDGANVGTSPPVAFYLAPDPDPDTTPPTLTVTLSPDQLWPANHQMVEIAAQVTATDDEDSDPRIELVSVTSDEPANGTGDGDRSPDVDGAAIGTEDYVFDVRAERNGSLDGRTYTVTYRASDACGNSVTASAEIGVAHDRR